MTISALLVGGECTGKSVLATQLVREFEQPGYSGIVVPEALRSFVDRTGRTPTRDEQKSIWHKQAEALRRAMESHVDLVVCDPAPLMTAVYSIQYFGDDSLLEPSLADITRTDAVIWCQPDIDWQPDGRHRDGPDARETTHDLLTSLVAPRLDKQRLHVARGSLDERLASTMDFLTSHM